jgi:L-lactate dehydrogenase complex protein LldE
MDRERRRVGLFVTCLVDQVFPDVGVATVRVLRRAGCEVEFPLAQTCCGQPFFNSGFRDQAAELAKGTVAALEPYEAIVLPSGSCTAMIRTEYVHLLARWPEWQKRAEAVANKTFELTEYLTDEAHWTPEKAGGPAEVTYHDSCHMCRLLGVKEAPRSLLGAIGCRASEMHESDRCCGFGGLFSLRMPEVSNAMTAEKLRQASETGVQILVTSDPGCLMQIRGLSEGRTMRAAHIATILEEATR